MALETHPLGRYPLRSIMNGIRDDLGAEEPKDVAVTDRTTIQWFHGRRFLPVNVRRPPSYVWFLERIEPNAPFKGDIGEYNAEATGAEVVVVSSWGRTEDEAWALRHNLIGAARDSYGADCKYLGCEPQEPDDFKLGFGFVTRLSFVVPVIGQRVEVATIEELGNTAYIVIGGTDILASED